MLSHAIKLLPFHVYIKINNAKLQLMNKDVKAKYITIRAVFKALISFARLL